MNSSSSFECNLSYFKNCVAAERISKYGKRSILSDGEIARIYDNTHIKLESTD